MCLDVTDHKTIKSAITVLSYHKWQIQMRIKGMLSYKIIFAVLNV